MDDLVRRITGRLETHKHCTAFENELERVWPSLKNLQAARFAEIEAFAKKHGWSVTIRDPGVRATFKKLESSQPTKPRKQVLVSA